MALVIRVGPARQQWWLDHMQALLPEIECRPWDDPGDPSEIEYAIVWKPPPGGLKRFSNLKCIVSMGAGIDHVTNDPELPRHVPIIRTTGFDLTQRMREYVTLHVLRIHRRLPEIEAAQPVREWRQLINPPAYRAQGRDHGARQPRRRMRPHPQGGRLRRGRLGAAPEGDRGHRLLRRRRSAPLRSSSGPRSWSACCRSRPRPAAS